MKLTIVLAFLFCMLAASYSCLKVEAPNSQARKLVKTGRRLLREQEKVNAQSTRFIGSILNALVDGIGGR